MHLSLFNDIGNGITTLGSFGIHHTAGRPALD